MAGKSYAAALAALRTTIGNNADFRDPFEKLAPYAATGAPTPDALREEFLILEKPVAVALDKSVAQNWQERLLAEIKGFISIRSVHGGGVSGVLGESEEALAVGNVAAALGAVAKLPAAGQDVLKDWRAQAEARQNIDEGLKMLAERFTGKTAPTALPSAKAHPEGKP
jgi:hypothetical protein